MLVEEEVSLMLILQLEKSFSKLYQSSLLSWMTFMMAIIAPQHKLLRHFQVTKEADYRCKAL